MQKKRIALLHLLLHAGEIEYNQNLIEKAVRLAADKKADWIITPELTTSGLQFDQKIGTNWISEQPDEWMTAFQTLVKSTNTFVFLGCPEKSAQGDFYNSIFVINPKGQVIGTQRKISGVIDNWSSSGTEMKPVDVEDAKVGIMICADAYTNKVADSFLAKGADVIVAPSSWGKGLHGPNGEWEQRSLETGLPVFVCNRTGKDETVRFFEAESLVIKNGEHLLSYQSQQSAVLLFDWHLEKQGLLSDGFEVYELT